MPAAEAVARRLGAPLDVYVVRKIGFPGHEEFAMGAVASGGVVLLRFARVCVARRYVVSGVSAFRSE